MYILYIFLMHNTQSADAGGQEVKCIDLKKKKKKGSAPMDTFFQIQKQRIKLYHFYEYNQLQMSSHKM